jgi:hypothetical protein
MAQPVNRSKELNLNKPDTFNGDQEKFRKFLQDIKVYMDVNHEIYNTNLRKISFVLLFMNAGAAPHGRHSLSMKQMPDQLLLIQMTSWEHIQHLEKNWSKHFPCLIHLGMHLTNCGPSE